MKDHKKPEKELFNSMIKYAAKQSTEHAPDPDKLPTMDASDNFKKNMDRMFQNAYLKDQAKTSFLTIRKVAVIALVIFGASLVTIMSVDAFREPVLNFFLKKDSQNSRIHIGTSKPNTKLSFSFGYIPKGYKLVKTHISSDKTQITYKFENNNRKRITAVILYNQSYDFITETNKSKYQKLTIQSKDYYYYHKKKNFILHFYSHTFYQLSSTLSKDELIKMIQNITVS